MTDKIDRPKSLSVNAWTGESAPSQTLPEKTPWALQDNLAAIRGWLAAPVEADERDWAHPDVGWGLVLPDNDAICVADRVSGADAPEPCDGCWKSAPARRFCVGVPNCSRGIYAVIMPMVLLRTFRLPQSNRASLADACRAIC
jgi:hypothetical protein